MKDDRQWGGVGGEHNELTDTTIESLGRFVRTPVLPVSYSNPRILI